jgi:predicted permease
MVMPPLRVSIPSPFTVVIGLLTSAIAEDSTFTPALPLMLTSAFGSSALVGYPLIQFAFPNDPHALADAVLISELGVGLPLFILAPLVAMHFGAQAGKAPAISATLLGYLRSPIFIAVALGLILAQARLPLDGPLLAPFMEALRMIEGALTVGACLILGIQLSLGSLGGAWLLVAVAAGINMLFQPWLAGLLGTLTGIGDEQRQILVLISAMPSAVLGPVFATRYDCAPKKATAIVFANIVLSLVAVPAVFSALVR